MIKAAEIVEAHDFISNLPKQYDSIIGEEGCKLSEGQKQRIALARAVIARPKILMLDEAMSLATNAGTHPLYAGMVSCGVVVTCRAIGDWRRAREWTEVALD